MKENKMSRYTACSSLDDIARAKSELREKITIQKERINTLSAHLLPNDSTVSNTFSLFKNIKSGIAIVNGVLLGLRMMRKIRQIFQVNK